jgi:hypothetical protein
LIRIELSHFIDYFMTARVQRPFTPIYSPVVCCGTPAPRIENRSACLQAKMGNGSRFNLIAQRGAFSEMVNRH